MADIVRDSDRNDNPASGGSSVDPDPPAPSFNTPSDDPADSTRGLVEPVQGLTECASRTQYNVTLEEGQTTLSPSPLQSISHSLAQQSPDRLDEGTAVSSDGKSCPDPVTSSNVISPASQSLQASVITSELTSDGVDGISQLETTATIDSGKSSQSLKKEEDLKESTCFYSTEVKPATKSSFTSSDVHILPTESAPESSYLSASEVESFRKNSSFIPKEATESPSGGTPVRDLPSSTSAEVTSVSPTELKQIREISSVSTKEIEPSRPKSPFSSKELATSSTEGKTVPTFSSVSTTELGEKSFFSPTENRQVSLSPEHAVLAEGGFSSFSEIGGVATRGSVVLTPTERVSASDSSSLLTTELAVTGKEIVGPSLGESPSFSETGEAAKEFLSLSSAELAPARNSSFHQKEEPAKESLHLSTETVSERETSVFHLKVQTKEPSVISTDEIRPTLSLPLLPQEKAPTKESLSFSTDKTPPKTPLHLFSQEKVPSKDEPLPRTSLELYPQEKVQPSEASPFSTEAPTKESSFLSSTEKLRSEDSFSLSLTEETSPNKSSLPAQGSRLQPESLPEGAKMMARVQIQSQYTPPQQPFTQQQCEPVAPQVPAPSKPEDQASCKYRWGKVVPTSASRVIFFCSAHPKEPIFLYWSPHNGAYFSAELHAPCGDFAGHVIVDGKTYPVEPFHVRSYTFEVDLFLKDDVIEDEVATSNTEAEELKFQQQQQQQQQGSVDIYRDINSAFTAKSTMEDNTDMDENGIHHNTKYEALLRQQLQHKDSLDANLESELITSQKSDHLSSGSGSKRLTPVGDIDKEPYQDGFSSLPAGDIGTYESSALTRSFDRRTPQNTFSGSASDLRQDTDRHSVKSAELGSSHHSLGDAPVSDSILAKPPSRAGSDHSAGLGTGLLSSQRDLFESTGRPGSSASLDRRIEDVLGGAGSYSSSARQSPLREPIGDVLGTEAILNSSVRPGSARQTPERDVGLIGSSRSTPLREMSSVRRGSQERLYGSQELPPPGEHALSGSRPSSQAGSRPSSLAGSHPGSLAGSRAGSQQASRAQSFSSLTSEQELSQILETNNSRPSSDYRRSTQNFDTHPDESATLPPIMRDRDRPLSLPAYSTQSPAGVDRRTYTPDNTWSGVAGGEGSGRGVTKSNLSSRASSRTVTPVNTSDREESVKVRDLEETVATLRKLLSSREQEVHELTNQLRDLKDINKSLKKDLEHSRSRRVPSGSEDLAHQYEQLLQEKEILAGEVVKLRDRLESSKGTGVDSFSSHSATNMQRRIDELESHVKDLRYSKDSAAQKLLRAEMQVKELTAENDKLRSSSSLNVKDLDDRSGGGYGDRRHQIETQQLKEDVRTLRDRNYTLQDEILKLREGKEAPRTSDLRTREHLRDYTGRGPILSSSTRSDDGVRQRPTESTMREESGYHLSDHSRSKHLPPSDPPISPGRRLDRSYGSDTFPASSRDLHPRSLDRSFGSDQGTRDLPRETSSYSRSRLENGEKESSDRLAKYRDFSSERGTDFKSTDFKSSDFKTTNRYDLLRSRPDGEVSEKLHATDGSRYGSLSAEKLRSFDRERELEHGQRKVTMSAERLRILEEAERNRERRTQATAGSSGRRPMSSDLPLSSKDDTRQRKTEGNNSDDSDATSILMSYDVKADTFSGQHEREKSSHVERTRSQDSYYERSYRQEKDEGKQRDRDYRDVRSGYKETNGDDSDTATDILLSAEPARNSSLPPPSNRRHRRSSIGDDASLSSLSDGDDPQDTLRRRSKSAEPKGKKGSSRYGQTTTLRPAASTERLAGGKTVTLSSGFRTVTPQPLATQHNKTALIQQASLSNSFTQGLRPFAPRSASDIRVDDVVKFSRQGGKLSQGTVKFVGHLPGRSDIYLGVELYKEEGKHDGTFESIRYFKCKPDKGVFVAFNKVVMAWAPN